MCKYRPNRCLLFKYLPIQTPVHSPIRSHVGISEQLILEQLQLAQEAGFKFESKFRALAGDLTITPKYYFSRQSDQIEGFDEKLICQVLTAVLTAQAEPRLVAQAQSVSESAEVAAGSDKLQFREKSAATVAIQELKMISCLENFGLFYIDDLSKQRASDQIPIELHVHFKWLCTRACRLSLA